MVDWARENAALNQLQDAPIRWIVDDAIKFLEERLSVEINMKLSARSAFVWARKKRRIIQDRRADEPNLGFSSPAFK